MTLDEAKKIIELAASKRFKGTLAEFCEAARLVDKSIDTKAQDERIAKVADKIYKP